MKNLVNKIVEYLRDNPEGYWFKRKLYGYGWTPATRAGWAVTLLALAFVIGSVVRFETGSYAESEIMKQVLIPSLLAVSLLISICIKKGERPKWQWDLSKDNDQHK